MDHDKKAPSGTHSGLVQAALEARKLALAPYSGFRVGAALLTAGGTIITAGNIESSSYSLTLCAERVALFKALSDGENTFETIAIASETEEFCTPCGACRQVLWDYARDIRVILVNNSGATRELSLGELLPHAFDDRMF